MDETERYLLEAIELARENIGRGGRPFGAVVVKDGRVIARGVNETHITNDPTAHAELLAVREASQVLGSPNLAGCAVYASGNPCPMCLASMRMAGVESVAYAYSNDDGAPFGLSSAAIYADLARPFAEQSMPITYLPVRSKGQQHLYDEWQAARTQRDQ